MPPPSAGPPTRSTSRLRWWRGKDSNLRRRKPADLQSAPVGRLGTPPQNEPRIVISTWRGVNASWPVICLALQGLEEAVGDADERRPHLISAAPSAPEPGPPPAAAREAPALP